MTLGESERRKILLVGEDFGNSLAQYHSNRYALTGQSGQRIATLAGLSFPEAYVRVFDRTNVVTRPVDWDDRDAVAHGVERVMSMIAERDRVMLLGRRVAAALEVLDMCLLEWKSWPSWRDGTTVSATVARFPHPSGRNRWWNELGNIELARAFLKNAVKS